GRTIQADLIHLLVIDDIIKICYDLFVLVFDNQPLSSGSPEHVVALQAVDKVSFAGSVHRDRLVFLFPFIGNPIDTAMFGIPQWIDISIPLTIIETFWRRIVLNDKVIPI